MGLGYDHSRIKMQALKFLKEMGNDILKAEFFLTFPVMYNQLKNNTSINLKLSKQEM